MLLAREGASVVVTDIDAAAAKQTVGVIAGADGTARFCEHDVSDERSWTDVMDQVDEAFGRVDVLVKMPGSCC